VMERRPIGPGLVVLVSPSLEEQGFLAAWTERTGGVSDGPRSSLNLSFQGDRAALVRQNRQRLAAALGIPPFATARQPHGPRVSQVGALRAGAGFHRAWKAIRRADALGTGRRRTPVAVLAADCVPLVLASQRETRLVAVHAGWRGLAAGILARAVARFRSPEGIHAAVGPAIGPCHYEVSPEVAGAVGAGTGEAVTSIRGGRLFLDLPSTVEGALRRRGIPHVELAGECTACEEGRFFSHRRDGPTGRQALVAMRL
jgi:YfiH family protein